MFRWTYGNIKRDKVRNKVIHDKIGVVFIEKKKMHKNCLR